MISFHDGPAVTVLDTFHRNVPQSDGTTVAEFYKVIEWKSPVYIAEDGSARRYAVMGRLKKGELSHETMLLGLRTTPHPECRYVYATEEFDTEAPAQAASIVFNSEPPIALFPDGSEFATRQDGDLDIVKEGPKVMGLERFGNPTQVHHC